MKLVQLARPENVIIYIKKNFWIFCKKIIFMRFVESVLVSPVLVSDQTGFLGQTRI